MLVLVGAPPAPGYQPVCHHTVSPTPPLRVTVPGTPKRVKDLKAEGCQAVKWASQEGRGQLGMCRSSTQAATLCKTSPG